MKLLYLLWGDDVEYILITPFKNELNSLSQLKETIFNQTKKPLLWVLVDSNSNDGSYEAAMELFSGHSWVRVIKQIVFFEDGYSHINFSSAINEGYQYAKNLCIDQNLNYQYVGKTDATPQLLTNYFETLVNVLNKDSSVAFACGLQRLFLNGRDFEIKPNYKISLKAINDIRLYRKDFFDNIGGYPLLYSPDTILQIKALNRGWKVKITNDTYFIKSRLGGSKIGSWKGYKLKGKSMYSLCYHPILLLLNASYFSLKFPPHYQGIPLIIGYLFSIGRVKRVEDLEIRQYFWSKRLKEVIFSIFYSKVDSL